MIRAQQTKRCGNSLLAIMVILALIGFALAWLMPAAEEARARAKATENLKQVAKAVAQFQEKEKPEQPKEEPKPEKASKIPVPDKDAQNKNETLIKKLYLEDFAKAKDDPGTALNLAANLLALAKKETFDPALRYVGFTLARDLAAANGDMNTAMAAIDELVKHHDLDGLVLKTEVHTTAAPRVSTKEAGLNLIHSALELLDEAIALDNYEMARRLVEASEKAAEKTKTLAVFSRIEKRRQEMEHAEKEFARMKPFTAKLAKDPDDAEANLEMGKYWCTVKGRWERALPMLAKCSDPAWKSLALKDLAQPKETKMLLELGDGWDMLAEKEKGPAQKQLLARSFFWYQEALPGLEGLTRVRVAKRTDELARMELVRFAGGKPSEISALVRTFDKMDFNEIRALAVMPDGKLAVSAQVGDSRLRLWDVKNGKHLRQLDSGVPGGGKEDIQCVAISPDGNFAAAGSTDNRFRVWDLRTGVLTRIFTGHNDFVRGVHFLPDGKRILSACDDRTLRFWDLNSGQFLQQMQGHTAYINGLFVSKDGTRALTGSDDRTARLWNLTNATAIAQFPHNAPVWGVALSPDGRRAVTSSMDGNVKLWDTTTGKELKALDVKTVVWTVAFTPDGRHVITGGGGGPIFNKGAPLPPMGMPGQPGNLRIWDVETGKEVRKLEGHQGDVRALAITDDGRLLLSAGTDGLIRLWGGR